MLEDIITFTGPFSFASYTSGKPSTEKQFIRAAAHFPLKLTFVIILGSRFSLCSCWSLLLTHSL